MTTESKSRLLPERNSSTSAPLILLRLVTDAHVLPAKVKNASQIQTKRWNDRLTLSIDHNIHVA